MTSYDHQASVSQLPGADRSRWIALVALCAGFLMIILDQTIVNVALPSIQSDLHFSQSSLAWVVNAYLIAFGGLLLLVGRLGDLIGRRRIFLSGLALFTTASMLCGISQSQGLLIGARFVQGIGGAMTAAVILGMIVTMFPKPHERAKAISVYSFVASAGGALGLLLGGVITQEINWHWIFFVNLPIGIATAVFAVRLLPDDRGIGLDRGADVPGAVLLVSALMLAVYTIVEASHYAWGSVHTIGFGAAAAALLAGFVVRQRTAASPLVPLRIFRSRTVTGANLVQVLMVAGLFGMFFLGALYMQRVLGYDAIQVGLAFLPVALGIAVMSLGFAARLMEPLWPQADARTGAGTGGDRACPLTVQPSSCPIPAGPAANDGAVRDRRRDRVPVTDDAGHVRRHHRGLRPGLRLGQHHPAGGRRTGAGRPRHPLGQPHEHSAARWRLARRLADEWVSSGLQHRRRARNRGDRVGGDGAVDPCHADRRGCGAP